jgi:SAM-dependent methyltransferase
VVTNLSRESRAEVAMSAPPSILKRLLLQSRAVLSTKLLVNNPYVPDIFLPYKPNETSYLLLKSEDQNRERSGFPIPPDHLRRYITYGETPELFLNSGKEHVDEMKHILSNSDFLIEHSNRILDFGCGAGRMIRWLGDSVERCEVWGADIQAEHIIWCQQHLSPPFKFVTVTTAPHLPFEDRYFDLIYCASVFTHIDDLADAWLLELKRILQLGGRLYITIHDKHSMQIAMASDWSVGEALRLHDKKKMISQIDFNMFSMGRGHSSQVFYDINYLQRHWGCFLDVVSVTQDVYGGQTGILLKK